ncbi:hypothetical protein TrispH2_004199 [Trichoplax sp. H2]|nr:hypothetical protein TrispH2_004199 [Trichoplax sp. H2]|eukprot:RDD44007.1 hypothetical protein TrispH2_004199 [Trichoplax sp. H2]
MPLEAHLHRIVLKYKAELLDYLPGRIFYSCLQHKDPVLSYLWIEIDRSKSNADTGKSAITQNKKILDSIYNQTLSVNEILINKLLDGTEDHFVLFYKTLQVQNHSMLIALGEKLEAEAKSYSTKIAGIMNNHIVPTKQGLIVSLPNQTVRKIKNSKSNGQTKAASQIIKLGSVTSSCPS